jgi:hypothetical protein
MFFLGGESPDLDSKFSPLGSYINYLFNSYLPEPRFILRFNYLIKLKH